MDLGAWALMAIVRLSPVMADDARAIELADAIGMASRTREDAALLVSIAWWETGRTFDLHPVGDHGHSVSPFQLWCSIGSFEQALLAANLDLAAMEALKRARESVRACRALAPEDRLSIYTSGRCRPNREAKIRWQTSRWLLKVVPEWQDVDDIT